MHVGARRKQFFHHRSMTVKYRSAQIIITIDMHVGTRRRQYLPGDAGENCHDHLASVCRGVGPRLGSLFLGWVPLREIASTNLLCASLRPGV
jgi:hypothetical protein